VVPQRISVVGVPGSGKSTFGRALAGTIDAPFTELDSMFHRPGWTHPDDEEFRAQARELVAGHRWVIDGNYSSVQDIVWGRADAVVWLDPPRLTATGRVLRRTLRRVGRGEELWNGNREHWTSLLSRDPEQNIVLWSWVKHPGYRATYGAAFDEQGPPGQQRIRIRSDEQARLLLDELAEQSTAAVSSPDPTSPGAGARIRPFRPGDEDALMDVCLRTGDAGGDATEHLVDGSLMGALWCLPYLVVEPELASVVVFGDGRPVGYVLGALDGAAFRSAAEERYWPAARERHPVGSAPVDSLDELLVALVHDRSNAAGSGVESELERRFPSHLHIDLLPEAQGMGLGRQLIERLVGQLASLGSHGVHLGVSKANHRAVAFYRHLGFTEWEPAEDGINRTFVRQIT